MDITNLTYVDLIKRCRECDLDELYGKCTRVTEALYGGQIVTVGPHYFKATQKDFYGNISKNSSIRCYTENIKEFESI